MPGKNSDALKQQRAVDTREAILIGAARVFARDSYARARMKDVAAMSAVSEGALYFHFSGKADVALAVLSRQQEKMTSVLTECLAIPGDGLAKLIAVVHGLGELIASDEVVQGGIRLDSESSGEIASTADRAYMEWVRIARTLIQRGVEDGSVHPAVDVDAAAEQANYLFVGAQVIAGKADRWGSLASRMSAVEAALRRLLASPQGE